MGDSTEAAAAVFECTAILSKHENDASPGIGGGSGDESAERASSAARGLVGECHATPFANHGGRFNGSRRYPPPPPSPPTTLVLLVLVVLVVVDVAAAATVTFGPGATGRGQERAAHAPRGQREREGGLRGAAHGRRRVLREGGFRARGGRVRQGRSARLGHSRAVVFPRRR